jgi:hypothetical protein
MSNPIAIVCTHYTNTTNNNTKKKKIYWTNKLQRRSQYTSAPKNQNGIIKIKQDKKNDNNIFGNGRKSIVNNIMDSNVLPLGTLRKVYLHW